MFPLNGRACSAVICLAYGWISKKAREQDQTEWEEESLILNVVHFIFTIFNYVCVHLCVSVYVCACKCKCTRRLEVSDFLELEFQVVVSHLVWTSARAVKTLNL